MKKLLWLVIIVSACTLNKEDKLKVYNEGLDSIKDVVQMGKIFEPWKIKEVSEHNNMGSYWTIDYEQLNWTKNQQKWVIHYGLYTHASSSQRFDNPASGCYVLYITVHDYKIAAIWKKELLNEVY